MASHSKTILLFCLTFAPFFHWSYSTGPPNARSGGSFPPFVSPAPANLEAFNWSHEPLGTNLSHLSDPALVSRILNRPPKPQVQVDTKWTEDQSGGSIATATTVTEEESFCRDRYVRGNCRDRDNPFDCDRHQWTAYATIHNTKGIYRIRSFPEGLYVAPPSPVLTTTWNNWESPRPIRVSLTVSCCTQVVQFLGEVLGAPDYHQTCILNVNELQGLQVWEYGLIIFASVLVFLVLVVGMGYYLFHKRRNHNKSSNPHHHHRFRRP